MVYTHCASATVPTACAPRNSILTYLSPHCVISTFVGLRSTLTASAVITMRILGAAARIPKRDETIPSSLRQSARNLHQLPPPSTSSDPKSTTNFNTWRTRNLDEDDERIALGDWLPSPAMSQSKVSSTSSRTDTEPWVTAFIVAHFHHDHGQTVDICLPCGVLTQAELDTVCYHAMPDSASMNSVSQDAIFSFRIPRRLNPSEEKSGQISVASTRLLLAHTLFRQNPDPSQPRGFFQKALVIVTSTPYLSLPGVMLSVLAPKVFVHGKAVLEQAICDLANWPDPRLHSISERLTLPFVGERISLTIPHSFLLSFAAPVAEKAIPTSNIAPKRMSPTAITSYRSKSDQDPWDVSSSTKAGATQPEVTHSWALCSPSDNWSVPLFHEINPVVALTGVLDHLPTLWEILVTGEPLLVHAYTPTACSAAVMALLGVIHPLPFIGDWRPYFSIHDADYDRIVRARQVGDLFVEGAVYGVTNQFLVETLAFPHVLYLPYVRRDGKSFKGRLDTPIRSCLQRSRTVKLAAARALNASNHFSLREVTEQVILFRAHVYDKYTRPFLQAFDQYLLPQWHGSLLTPGASYQNDPFGKAPVLPRLELMAFPSPDDVLQAQKTACFKKGSFWRGRVRQLYERFVVGPVFREWWHDIRTSAERECLSKHQDCLIAASMNVKTCLNTRKESGEFKRIAVDDLVDMQARVRLELSNVQESEGTLRDALQNLLNCLSQQIPSACQTEELKSDSEKSRS